MRARPDFVRPDPDPRRLAAVPADPAAARTLRPEQVEHYNEQGFLGPLPLLSPAEAGRLDGYLTRLVDDVVAAPDRRDSYSINAYHLVCEGLYELTVIPALLDYVQDLLGPDVVCWGSTVFCKLPGDPREISLHQDAAFWPFTSSRSVTAWLSVDGAGTDNGAMQFVPGSHRLGPLEHDVLPLDGTRVRARQVAHPERYPDRYDDVLAAGEVSLHADLMLHGSPPNRSDRRRTGVTLRYAAADVEVLPGWEWWYGGAVHGRGTIPPHWPGRRRPRGEHPELMAAFTERAGALPTGD